MVLSYEAYGGSRLLLLISDKIGLPIDQVNFITCQLLALLLGFPFRLITSPQNVGPTIRHLIEVIVGFSLAWFCYGSEVGHLLLQSLLCYVFMMVLRNHAMPKLVLAVSLGYLCYSHIWRVIYDYGGYTLNISGPLMINTQRISCLAFALWDGQRSDKNKLPDALLKRAVKRLPNVLEYASYVFSFHGIGCGPFCFYDDYTAFIEGKNFEERNDDGSKTVVDDKVHKKNAGVQSPNRAVLFKLTAAVFFGFVTSTFAAMFPLSILTDSDFIHRPFFNKMFFIILITSIARTKYYFAWELAEAVNINAGLGFNGYDKKGKAKYDLLKNADIPGAEFGTSLKAILDSWNITTTSWLRYVVYDRIHSMPAVFVLSAFWHGFYAGYYITFLSGAFITTVSRMVRRTFRPRFQNSKQMIILYELITGACSRVLLAYVACPFLVLEFWKTFEIYWSIYFCVYVAAICLAVLAMIIPPPKSAKKELKISGESVKKEIETAIKQE